MPFINKNMYKIHVKWYVLGHTTNTYVVKKAFSGGALILTYMDGEELSRPVNADAVKRYYALKKKKRVCMKTQKGAPSKKREKRRKPKRALSAKWAKGENPKGRPGKESKKKSQEWKPKRTLLVEDNEEIRRIPRSEDSKIHNTLFRRSLETMAIEGLQN